MRSSWLLLAVVPISLVSGRTISQSLTSDEKRTTDNATVGEAQFEKVSINGRFNQYGTDEGISNQMKNEGNGIWSYKLVAEWPSNVTLNATRQPGRERQASDFVNRFMIENSPSYPHLGWEIVLDESSQTTLYPVGSQMYQIIIFALLAGIPVISATLGVLLYVQSFYQVKFNKYGVSRSSLLPWRIRQKFHRIPSGPYLHETQGNEKTVSRLNLPYRSNDPGHGSEFGLLAAAGAPDRRRVLIATMEYDIEDWAIKIKIGGLGVMAQLMGKNLSHQDLIWVVPCVGGVDYPETPEEEADPMVVQILGSRYEIQVRTHILRNITYVLLDAPVFRSQSKSDPYPERMDDLESAIYYAAWNQCIAEAIKRYQPHLYHINDYHGAIAPLYLLPDTIPCCLSLHNAEFQGLWPMRNPQEVEEVCRVYNLPSQTVSEYVQFGEVFNLLHAGASYLRIHQNGFGAVGVSKKYGKRSWARYPIFWGLQTIGALPNPDPSDTAEWNRNEEPTSSKVEVDPEFEATRGDLRKQAQEWAGLKIDPEAELFVFVGRWSMQKGIDLIADIFPSILEKHSRTQLICVGPVIDLYGRFAAIKLDKLMKVYPGRVFSRPEFTQLPPFIFSGAEFALIPSRDEPFGLVAVEFGRKGALGVGARVGGLGQMPGWWFTVESTTTKHMLSQFGHAIEDALSSKKPVRAQLRARSARQRFPVAQWVEDLETLQNMSVQKHERTANKSRRLSVQSHRRSASHETASNRQSMDIERPASRPQSRARAISSGSSQGRPQPPIPRIDITRYGSVKGPGHVQFRTETLEPIDHPSVQESSSSKPDPNSSTRPVSNKGSPAMRPRRLSELPRWAVDATSAGQSEEELSRISRPRSTSGATLFPDTYTHGYEDIANSSPYQPTVMPSWLETGRLPSIALPKPAASRASSVGAYDNDDREELHMPTLRVSHSRNDSEENLLNPDEQYPYKRSRRVSNLSVNSIVGERKDFQLQSVAPVFKDQNKDYAREFEAKLSDLNGKNSSKTCIEEYIEKSEKDWFNRMREVKMGKRASHIFNNKAATASNPYIMVSQAGDDVDMEDNQFALQDDYIPPKGIRKLMIRKLGDWPLYSFILALGQIMSANSYQVTLLTGQIGGAVSKTYTVSAIYLVFSIIWWLLYRKVQSRYILSAPFILYAISFALIGTAPLIGSDYGKTWNQNVGTGFYAAASASGSIYFSLNFGDQGGATVPMWVFRACIIQGIQQVYIAGLWWWASTLQRLQSYGRNIATLPFTRPVVSTSVGLTISLLMTLFALSLFLGLPDYYRQTPGRVPSFFKSIYRRKLIIWFFLTVLIQNFFLSAPYGRSWLYLFSTSPHVPTYQLVLLILLFFLILWPALLYLFSFLSTSHSWIMPLFAIGLGSPRWAQMLWGTSGLGIFLPWTSSPIISVFAGRSLWLWLGLLDSFQGVGFGMILLTTLTRLHVSFTLISAQVIGSAATILALGVGPDRMGPGSVFPNLALDAADGVKQAWFWVGMVLNLGVCWGAFVFFRKEQLSKP